MTTNRKQPEKTQAKKFSEAAKELGCDTSEKGFERALKGVVDMTLESPKKASKKKR